ncbi:MAG: hypothetical protein V4659_04360 [Pseudomonadota bacterium]
MRLNLSERQAKFAREVGSVVLGVLIALGLGAIATEIGWWLEVRTARAALASELGEVIGQAKGRWRLAPCVERRLDELAAIVDQADRTGRLPPLGVPGNPPHRTWSSGVWESTINAQTAAHFDRELLDNYSGFYEFVAQIRDANYRELTVWTVLYGLAGPGRAVTPAEIATWRAALGEARLINRLIGLGGVRASQIADAFDLEFDPADVAEYGDRPLAKASTCAPIPAIPPANYGQAPMKGVIESAQADPIVRQGAGLVPSPRR